jgi:hypothetical protein
MHRHAFSGAGASPHAPRWKVAVRASYEPPEGVTNRKSFAIIYCRERARLARKKADTATTAEAKNGGLATEARWLALARSYEQQDRLSKALGGNERKDPVSRAARERAYSLDPEVVAIVSSAFHPAFAQLSLSDSDEVAALRVARRIIDLAAQGERDPGRLKAVVLAWVTK